jgi:MFS family permease
MSEATPATALAASGLRRSMVASYLAGLSSAVLAGQIWLVVLGWAAARLGDPTHTSLALAAGTVPRALLLLFGGAVADRHGAQRIARLSQQARVALMAVAAVALWATGDNMPLLLVLALLIGALDALYLPAAGALAPLVVATPDLPALQGLLQTLERGLLLVGAPLGGLLIGWAGLPASAVIIAVLSGCAVLAFSALPRQGPVVDQDKSESAWGSIVAGLRYVGGRPELWIVLVVITIVNATLSDAVNVGLVLASRQHGWGPTGLGWAIAGFAAGATVGALTLTRLRSRTAPAVVGLLWVAVAALGVAGLAAASSLLAAIVLLAVTGVAAAPATALLVGVIQANTDSLYLGRVMSLLSFSALGLAPMTYAAFGALAEIISLRGAFLAAGISGLAVAILATAAPAVRRARLEPLSESAATAPRAASASPEPH